MVEIWIPLLVRHEKSRKNSEDPGSPGTTRAWKDFLKNLPRCGCPASTAHQTLRHAEHLGTLTRQVRPSSDYGKNMRCQHPRAKSWLRSLANLAKNRKPSTKMKNNVNMFAFDLTDPYGLGAVAIDYHLQLLLRRWPRSVAKIALLLSVFLRSFSHQSVPVSTSSFLSGKGTIWEWSTHAAAWAARAKGIVPGTQEDWSRDRHYGTFALWLLL